MQNCLKVSSIGLIKQIPFISCSLLFTGLPWSWKNHGILKFSGISEKSHGFFFTNWEGSWKFEIGAKGNGKIVEFDKRILHSYEFSGISKKNHGFFLLKLGRVIEV